MKNFVSISVDDLIAFQTLKDMFGSVLHTPNIDRLLDLGVGFENAFAQISLCNPSRTSILSGLSPTTTKVIDNSTTWYEEIDTAHTLPTLLSATGYQTSVIGKVYHQPASQLAALPGFENIHFSSDVSGWNGPSGPFRTGVLQMPEEQHGDHVNVSEAVNQIENWTSDAPNALFIGIYRPHADWTVPQQYYDLYNIEDIVLPLHSVTDRDDLPAFVDGIIKDSFHNRVVAADYWKEVLQAYFASVSFADAQVGRVLDALEAGGRLQDTVITLWSDHGYHLGDKDKWHKFTLWDEGGRAPMIIYDPDHAATGGHRVDTTVELLDLAPTVLELLGVTPTWTLEGQSLVDMFDPATAFSTATGGGQAITTLYGSASIRTDTHRYILYNDGSEEFYDLSVDPRQEVNLANDPLHEALKLDLYARLSDRLGQDGWQFVATSVDLSLETDDLTIVLQNDDSEVDGGLGDDTYFVVSDQSTIRESENGGIDSVYFLGPYTMPDNVENAFASTLGQPVDRTVTGNDLNNVIRGASWIEGLGGDDALRLGLSGYADGGEGNDFIEGRGGIDTLIGGSGNDTLSGAGNNDLLIGGEDDDRLLGGNGNDTLMPGEGSNFVSGNSGVDTLDISDLGAGATVDLQINSLISATGTTNVFGVQAVVGTMFADSIIGKSEDNSFWSGEGDDRLKPGEGNNFADGGLGFDILDLSDLTGSVIVDIPTGWATSATSVTRFLGVEGVIGTFYADVIFADGAENVLWGGGGSDRLFGQEGADLIFGDNEDGLGTPGGPNDDLLVGRAGHDTLRGGEGNDTAYGGLDEDSIDGGDGDDFLTGGIGNDSIDGGAGNDTIIGGSDEDFIQGGDGDDFISGAQQTDTIYGGEGNDTLAGVGGFDFVYGEGGNDWITGNRGSDTIEGGDGDDRLFGNEENDHVSGNSGRDTMQGGEGDDKLFGGDGNDRLFGGTGNDTLTGGAGSDDFMLQESFGFDVIMDFDALDVSEDINVRGLASIVDWADLAANHLFEIDLSTVEIRDGLGNVVTLVGVAYADLDETDFLF